MFENIGFTELLLILAVALLIFGPQKLPQLGKSLGGALREFRKATREITDEISRELNVEEPGSPQVARGSPVQPSAANSDHSPAEIPAEASLPSTNPTANRHESDSHLHQASAQGRSAL